MVRMKAVNFRRIMRIEGSIESQFFYSIHQSIYRIWGRL